ncbi:hypothetical protein BD309DRAFT_497229 [Dichomitus squalens]|uniref:Uncharacterized protein n=1 Tax=Dichomitus squalens TaxID=114155 RepID=A0A4Q9P6X2_9APHY|nr:uncharacterized protein DICSQDRAFT_152222 [Dichomitus squalens LYAD-421 SS1]EJF66248.1 hypothetical protein DICSQDRAFT_152222 [Dichomitus squalens LYAD-421 SS1]TBU50234.1 hypothetical protein BD309DRAFT_497229 [Dichomitus squalens]TBU65359.1 hypothetical protein BD310DRAFT_803000 [Dichomitus squalens]
MQPSTIKPQRIQHTRAPSLSFSYFPFPSDRQFPLYAHCNSQRTGCVPTIRCDTNLVVSSHRRDLMQTVDYRFSPKCTRRSSFALSDIFEMDEEVVEFEISPILPSTPNSATTRSVKLRMKTALHDFVQAVKTKLNHPRSPKMYIVEPANSSRKVVL